VEIGNAKIEALSAEKTDLSNKLNATESNLVLANSDLLKSRKEIALLKE
jgi:hypothetical protein